MSHPMQLSTPLFYLAYFPSVSYLFLLFNSEYQEAYDLSPPECGKCHGVRVEGQAGQEGHRPKPHT